MKQTENMKIWAVWNRSYNTTYCSCSCLVNCIYWILHSNRFHTCKSHNMKQIWNTKTLQ